MKLKKLFKKIRQWSTDKGIYDQSDILSQFDKLVEELDELDLAIDTFGKNDVNHDINDAIGDMIVVLTNIAHMNGTTIEKCIEGAYNEIKDRKGKMIDGLFVKDLTEDEILDIECGRDNNMSNNI